ncbi:MAG TPA: M56 family metallopeptidase [Bryobacteraceae bacterium]|jgi:TonB family protein
MTLNVLQLATLCVKIALLAGLALGLLYLLRRAPASSRSRLCSVALVAIVMMGAGELFSTPWTLPAPVFILTTGAAVAAQAAVGSTSGVDLAWWLGLLWIAGALLMMGRAVAGRLVLTRWRRQSNFLEQVEGIDVRIGPVQTPLLCGLFRPAILLPEGSRAWTREQRAMIFTHELTHHRQGDPWSILLAQTVRAAFWFHPAVWMLVSRLSREQELACDEAVVAAGHPAHDYAAFLLDSARDLKSSDLFACAMAGSGAQSLKARIAQLLEPAPRFALRRRIVLALASLAMISLTLTAVRPVWSQETKERKTYKVGDGIVPPRVLYRVDPEYSQEAKDSRIAGTVVLKMVVTEDGLADEITVVRGIDSGLDEKAVEALSKWRFQPGTKDGTPVAVWATIEVNFRLK